MARPKPSGFNITKANAQVVAEICSRPMASRLRSSRSRTRQIASVEQTRHGSTIVRCRRGVPRDVFPINKHSSFDRLSYDLLREGRIASAE